MDGAIHSEFDRPLVRTGPIELRDLGPNGRPLGTPADCEDDDSLWELHRGELVKIPMAHDIHSIVMAIVGSLFLTHVRDRYSVLTDVHCVLDDARGESRRAPDVVIAHQVTNPRNEPLRGVPVLAVEVRAAQSKKLLEEKVKLYIEHDWPTVWIVHTERHEVEVIEQGLAPVVYRPGAHVPLLPELDKYGLPSVPVTAFFDKHEASKYIDQWVARHARCSELARALREVLLARRLDVPHNVRTRIASSLDLEALQRWFSLALTATTVDDFIRGMD